MPGPYATASTWYCEGCGKTHPLSRDIEGDDFGRYWCGHSIRRAIAQRSNSLPDHFRNFTTELTPEGEQTVIPGCERNRSPRATQLDLFG